MSISFTISDVHIIESLAGGYSERTGHRLHEELVSLLPSLGLRAHHTQIETHSDLFAVLNAIADNAGLERRSPLVHFETHGDEERQGLVLASGQLVTWAELKPILTKLNEIGGLNLVVVVAACNGFDLLKTMQLTDRAPARAIIGPNSIVSAGALERAMFAFYKTAAQTMSLSSAFRAMNEAGAAPSAATTETFGIMTAELMFKLVMRRFFASYCTPDKIEERVRQIEVQNAIRRWPEPPISVHPNSRARARAFLANRQLHVDEFRTRFFFLDRYPENAARFPITVEDCENGP